MTGVSFVVTVYNKEPFLPGVLGALFAQEGDFARDYVIVDDGSTDGSYALIERLCAGREDVQLIRQRNAGPAVATNVGVRAARHPWLKIVDADDVLAPWCTRLMLEAAMRLDLRLAHGSGILYRLGETVDWGQVDPARVRPWRRDLFPHCLRNVPANLSVTLIDRALFWEVGGCDERIFTQDYLAAAAAVPAQPGGRGRCADLRQPGRGAGPRFGRSGGNAARYQCGDSALPRRDRRSFLARAPHRHRARLRPRLEVATAQTRHRLVVTLVLAVRAGEARAARACSTFPAGDVGRLRRARGRGRRQTRWRALARGSRCG